MSGKTPRRLPATKRRELEIVAAIAREAVTRHHVDSALRLIELGAERVPVIRMLAIYARLHGLRGAHAEQLAYSVLASLGNSTEIGELTAMLGDDDLTELDSESLLRVVRNRLRGRIHHDLRRWVEIATGSAQVGLLEVHLIHARRFVEELTETHTAGQACALYCDLAGVPDLLHTALTITLLDRLAARELPPRRDAIAQQKASMPLYPATGMRAKRAV
jgi:hypothetical protein